MERSEKQSLINNAFYEDLDTKWETAKDHPVALLRAENALRNPWISQIIQEKKGKHCQILDIGCGAGFLSNYLAEKNHIVTGIDLSEGSLSIAKKGKGLFLKADAEKLPFPDESFDVVCAMDLLEHVENPETVIQQASRVLKPGGLFFFHTFNRNWISYLVVIKGVEWFVKNTPPHMHVYSLFIKPKELEAICQKQGLIFESIQGLIPDLSSKGFWKMLWTKEVTEEFRFTFSKNLQTGYVGWAIKQ